jgi:L-histidine N-alpha-methyltransferase
MAAFHTTADRRDRRNFRELLTGAGTTILRKRTGYDRTIDFASSTVAGLSTCPRHLECRFLYDSRGSALFDRITEQPEYYLTRTEAAILAANAHRIREITGPVTLLELGSGSSVKTECLLRAWLDHSRSARYIPVDVSESALRRACRAIAKVHPAVRVVGVNADYRGAFPLFREASPAMVLFLGSSIGNFTREETSSFLGSLSTALSPGDFFLLGVDLVKEPSLIEAAYNDAAGVTAEFTRNLFVRMNRELGSGIELSAIEHVASYNRAEEQVDIHARFVRQQTVRVKPLEKSFIIEGGEMVQTEISRKFRMQELTLHLEKAGFETVEVFTDEHNWFSLFLLRRPDHPWICAAERMS